MWIQIKNYDSFCQYNVKHIYVLLLAILVLFTFVIGPWLLIGDDACEPVGFDPDDIDDRGLNAAILCDTPSAKMNCSRNSIFVRPLANVGVAEQWQWWWIFAIWVEVCG